MAKRKKPLGRPRVTSTERAVPLRTTIPEYMMTWLGDHGGPAKHLRILIGDAMRAEANQ